MTESSLPDPAAPLQHMDALPVGTRLGEFEIQALLGVGGFGMVYQAFDHSLRRSVAIKEYMPCALAGRAQGQSLWVRTSSDTQTFQAGLASFVKEAQLLAQFDHPSLVKVFRIWEANNTAYMVMPLYVGMTLKQARAQMRQPPSEAWLRQLLWPVLGALRVLHDAQTLHRDISPDNIFLQDNGPPVLLDLGAARQAIGEAERQHTAVLKVNYAPIEQYAAGDTGDAQALQQGPWSDLYSLGAVVYGCICNDTPLPATLRAMRDRMVRFRRVARTVQRQFGVEYSPAFVHAISETLHLQPSARPQSIDAFLARMEMTVAPEGGQAFHWREGLEDGEATGLEALGADSDQDEVEPTRFMEPVPGRAVVDVEVADLFMGGDATHAGGAVGATGPHGAPPAGQAVPESVGAASAHQAAHSERGGEAHHGRSRAARRRGGVPRAWLGACAVVGIVGVVAWWGLQAPAAKPLQDDDIITEWASPPPAAVQPVSLEGDAVAGATPAVLEPAEAPAAPVVAQGTAAASAPGASRKGVRAVVPASPPVPAPERAVPEPDHPPPERPTAAPSPRVVAPAPAPAELCADAGFLARPMCIHQECQKPSLSRHPVCVEHRQRQEAEAQRREFNGR